MKVISGIGQVHRAYERVVLAIGIFDGLHLGHQELIQTVVERARSINGTAMVLTFAPHPVHVLKPHVHLPYVVSVPHRLRLLEEYGVEVCVLHEFTRSFSELSGEMFMEQCVRKEIQPDEIYVGDDFRFGQGRQAGIDKFQTMGKQSGIGVHVVGAVKGEQQKISSTAIRHFIASGQIQNAEALLGRRVSVMGNVVAGDQRGRQLGYPTANIFPEGVVLPPLGVYAVDVVVNNLRHHGMANIGTRPSFVSRDKRVNIEVHLFDFNDSLYDKEIVVEFCEKIRDEKAFDHQAQLIQQLHEDEKQSRRIHSLFYK